MACDISLGRIEPCKDSVGGLDAVYFINDGDMTGVTFDAINTDVIETVLAGARGPRSCARPGASSG